MYIYVTIGEFVAFVLGWDLILEYVIGVSSGASALSRYIDSLCHYKIQEVFRTYMPMNIKNLAPYPDFLAFVLVLLITGEFQRRFKNVFLLFFNLFKGY